MRRQALLALAVTLAAPLAVDGAARATTTPTGGSALIKGAFGNTIVESYPDGRTAALWLNANGSYTGEGRRRDKSSGRWTVRSRQLCFHQSHPFAFGQSYCTPIPKVGLGQPWQAKAFTGEQITVKVVKGHVVPS